MSCMITIMLIACYALLKKFVESFLINRYVIIDCSLRNYCYPEIFTDYRNSLIATAFSLTHGCTCICSSQASVPSLASYWSSMHKCIINVHIIIAYRSHICFKVLCTCKYSVFEPLKMLFWVSRHTFALSPNCKNRNYIWNLVLQQS